MEWWHVVIIMAAMLVFMIKGNKNGGKKGSLKKTRPKAEPPAAPQDPADRCVWLVGALVRDDPDLVIRITDNVCMVTDERDGTTYVDVPCQITGVPGDAKNMDLSTAAPVLDTFCITYQEATGQYRWQEKGKVSFDAAGVCAQGDGPSGRIGQMEYHIYDGAQIASAVGVPFGQAAWGE